jgi:hypothetical protein
MKVFAYKIILLTLPLRNFSEHSCAFHTYVP